jgi:hypothetical protein
MASGQFRPVGEGIDMLRPLFSRPSQISHIDTVRKPLAEDSGSENVLVAGDLGPVRPTAFFQNASPPHRDRSDVARQLVDELGARIVQPPADG